MLKVAYGEGGGKLEKNGCVWNDAMGEQVAADWQHKGGSGGLKVEPDKRRCGDKGGLNANNAHSHCRVGTGAVFPGQTGHSIDGRSAAKILKSHELRRTLGLRPGRDQGL